MSFKQTIEMLSKGSAQAVSTLNSKSSDAEKLKKYLYLRTPVEKSLLSKLDESTDKRIIFLCGSSGDGKSEIFRRIHKRYSSKFRFHLDATHSFDPNKNAIQTLNDLFTEYRKTTAPLVVGINIGMLGNFAADGADAHSDIKTSVEQFLSGQDVTSKEYSFITFEEHPKFELDGDDIKAPFIGPLIKRICERDETNPIYVQSTQGPQTTDLHRNYKLLGVPEVQQRVCSLLFYAHLKFDQFLTTRTVLDFIYQLLTGKGSLFDSLFCGQGSELFDSLRMLDPCHARSKSLDLFQVKASLKLFDPEFMTFKEDIESLYGLNLTEPRSWVRLFYLMQDVDLSNNYHHRFRSDLKRDLFDEFRTVWQLHRDYSGNEKEKRLKLREFYNQRFISAVTSFANRFAPEIRSDRFLLGKLNGFALSATSTMKPELSRLAAEQPTQLRSFDAYLKVGSKHNVGPIPVSVNFLELARKINQGYRPNTHDKTTVVTLEELVEEVRRIVRQTECLYLQSSNAEWELINDEDENEIFVESR